MGSENPVEAASVVIPQAQSYEIRMATEADRIWLIPLSARLHDFGPPAWRSRDSMDRAVALSLEHALGSRSADRLILVAEDTHREPLGFAHVHKATDFFTGEVHSHISDLAVRLMTEGRGVGTALLRAAEAWALEQQHRLLTLNVFTANHRARELYERMGFLPDTIRLIKVVRSTEDLKI